MQRIFIALVIVAGFWSAPAFSQTVSQQTCSASYGALSAADKSAVSYESFIANCEATRKNWEAPPSNHVDPNLSHVTGMCADNSYTMSLNRASACANEGGVVAWFFGDNAPPESQAPAVAAPVIGNPPLQPAPAPPKPAAPSAKPAPPATPVAGGVS